MLLFKCRLLQMEIPADTVDIMHTTLTSYHLIYFTMRALHIAFPAPLSRVILEFVCEQQPDNFLTFHTLYPGSGFRQLHHSGVKGCEKYWDEGKNGFDLKHQSEINYFLVRNSFVIIIKS